MRGKPSRSPVVLSCRRIIPAHAGQTSGSTWNQSALPDHPRACGANTIIVAIVGCGGGSSPRMRGKQHHRLREATQRRIIPAHAGQTLYPAENRAQRADHPRACGANAPPTSGSRASVGSSPRMRGKQFQGVAGEFAGRIIPAHAGQTCAARSTTPNSADHPRACGANQYERFIVAVTVGSSPRMRGKPGLLEPRRQRPRIIPAHAGQTCP